MRQFNLDTQIWMLYERKTNGKYITLPVVPLLRWNINTLREGISNTCLDEI